MGSFSYVILWKTHCSFSRGAGEAGVGRELSRLRRRARDDETREFFHVDRGRWASPKPEDREDDCRGEIPSSTEYLLS